MLRRLGIAFTWIVVVAIGYAASVLYTSTRMDQTPIVQRVEAYDRLWKEALENVKGTPPPSAKEYLSKAPVWQRKKLQPQLTLLDEKYQPDYTKKADALLPDLRNEFMNQWTKALENFEDSPSVDKIIEGYDKIHQEHYRLKEELTKLDESQKKRHPRTQLALDSFSGYCVFRSPEFRNQLKEKNIRLHLVNDEAKYPERMKKLKDGTVPLAVFTIDALINTSASDDEPPVIVMVIDESRGADAIVTHREVLPDLDSLNRKDLRIVLIPDSPSETLARVVRSRFGQPKMMPQNCFVPAKEPEEIIKKFKESGKDPLAFVLWEPYVSQLLKDFPDAEVLTDSRLMSGFIVDVFVVNRQYLKTHREEVKEIVKAYLETAQEIQKPSGNMEKAVLEDSRSMHARDQSTPELTPELAEKVVQGILWKTTLENYAHFGLLPQEQIGKLSSLEQLIANIHQALKQTGALSTSIRPEIFLDRSICEELQKNKFDPGGGLRQPEPPPVPDDWQRLRPVGTLQLEPILFDRGSADIPDRSKPDLQELLNMMKTMPEYFLEIRGHARGNTEGDRELAQQRAKAVAQWLEKQGNIDNRRIRSKGAKETGEVAVTFKVLQKPGKK